jgi:hypothetical protein
LSLRDLASILKPKLPHDLFLLLEESLFGLLISLLGIFSLALQFLHGLAILYIELQILHC